MFISVVICVSLKKKSLSDQWYNWKILCKFALSLDSN